MGGINLSAVVFALLVVLWVAYALPGIARRRAMLGAAQAVVRERDSESVQVLSVPPALARATEHAPDASNGATMPEQRVLASREKYATTSPRIDPTAPHASAASAEPVARAHSSGTRQRQIRTGVLLALAAAVVGTLIAAIASPLPFWVPLGATAALALFVVALRRAEVRRLEAMERVHRLRAEVEAARTGQGVRSASPASAADDAAPFDLDAGDGGDTELLDPLDEDTDSVAGAGPDTTDRTWTPVPVPTPSYLLKEEAESVYQRLAAHRQAPFAFEAEDVEDQEWADEVAEGGAAAAAGTDVPRIGRADLRMAPQENLELDFDLDQVLARRRA